MIVHSTRISCCAESGFRTGIARTLSRNLDILIADESTGNLDESPQDGIMALCSGLVK
jgi:ABC-type ATPase involved in cell division